jgi:hypothetical protein
MIDTWAAPAGTIHEFEPTQGERFTATVVEVGPDKVVYNVESPTSGSVVLTIYLDDGAYNGYDTKPELNEDELQRILDLFESFDK